MKWTSELSWPPRHALNWTPFTSAGAEERGQKKKGRGRPARKSLPESHNAPKRGASFHVHAPKLWLWTAGLRDRRVARVWVASRRTRPGCRLWGPWPMAARAWRDGPTLGWALSEGLAVLRCGPMGVSSPGRGFRAASGWGQDGAGDAEVRMRLLRRRLRERG